MLLLLLRRPQLLQLYLQLAFYGPIKLGYVPLRIDQQELDRLSTAGRDDHAGAAKLLRVAFDPIGHDAETLRDLFFRALDKGLAVVHLGGSGKGIQ